MEEKNKDNPKYQIIANYVKDLSFEKHQTSFTV